MIENIVILFIFLLATLFLGRLVYQQFWGKQSGCTKGCGGACQTLPESKN